MVTLTNYTREEFLDIFRKAKARKAEWQKQVENEENYIAMILLKEHPHYDAIAKRFNEEVAMFKENK